MPCTGGLKGAGNHITCLLTRWGSACRGKVGAERSFPWPSDCCDMGAGHFLFCQYQRASGDDEKDLSGAGCDELVGKTEAVAVITADPVGGDAAEPGFS